MYINNKEYTYDWCGHTTYKLYHCDNDINHCYKCCRNNCFV